MATGAKAAIIASVMEHGHTESFGALLYLVAVMESDSKDLEPENNEERAEWRGHLAGLRAALHCLAMHELKASPESAAMLVEQQLSVAAGLLRRSGGAEAGE